MGVQKDKDLTYAEVKVPMRKPKQIEEKLNDKAAIDLKHTMGLAMSHTQCCGRVEMEMLLCFRLGLHFCPDVISCSSHSICK